MGVVVRVNQPIANGTSSTPKLKRCVENQKGELQNSQRTTTNKPLKLTFSVVCNFGPDFGVLNAEP